jgi:hypothetical protein
MTTSIILLILSALPTILQGFGITSPVLSTELSSLTTILPGLIASLTSGKGITNDAVAVLTAIQTELQTQMNAGLLNPTQYETADGIVADIQLALAAEVKAQAVTDPSNLPTNLPTNL